MRVSEAGFICFIRQEMGIAPIQLPDCSRAIVSAYLYAREIVSRQIELVSPRLYADAVYNLAADYLINWAPDSPASGGFFEKLREKYSITSFTAGVIQATADEGTSESMLIPEGFKNLTIGQLQNLKTPYGRAYLSIAQSIGSLWGIL